MATDWDHERRFRLTFGWADAANTDMFDDGPALVVRPALPSAFCLPPRPRCCPRWADLSGALQGHRIFIKRLGEGTVLGFQRAPVGPSAHVVKFDGGGGKQQYLKLKRKGNDELPWLYLPGSGTGSGGKLGPPLLPERP